MKLHPTELNRLRQRALHMETLSPDTQPEITRKVLSEFNKDILRTLAHKRQKSLLLTVVEV